MNEKQSGGLLCVVSSPSGGGKTSIIREIRRRNPECELSVSATTRPRRPSEVNGVDYYFLSQEEFDEHVKENRFVEWARVHGFHYGTLKEEISGKIAAGKTIMFDIDVYGGMSIRQEFPERSLLIFLCPPSEDELVNRLQKRNSESRHEIERRLERLRMEMSHADRYDIQIMNIDFIQTVEQVERAIRKCQARLEV